MAEKWFPPGFDTYQDYRAFRAAERGFMSGIVFTLLVLGLVAWFSR